MISWYFFRLCNLLLGITWQPAPDFFFAKKPKQKNGSSNDETLSTSCGAVARQTTYPSFGGEEKMIIRLLCFLFGSGRYCGCVTLKVALFSLFAKRSHHPVCMKY